VRLKLPLALILAASGTCSGQTVPGGLPALTKSVGVFLRSLDPDPAVRFVAAFRDLDGDGRPEAIVYLKGKGWCGSGGCTTLVLVQETDSWKVLSRITVTRPPVIVLAATSHGWHNIAVLVQGGGVLQGYEAELCFDGKKYPTNPSLSPARRLMGEPVGEVVIAEEVGGLPLGW
jgi:hypothetical protein